MQKKMHKNPCDFGLWSTTLIFNRLLEVVHAKFHETKCSGSWVFVLTCSEEEIWANAHETCDSISLILYAGCLGLSPVISTKIHCKCVLQPKIAKKITKNPYFAVQGRSRSSMLVPPQSSSAVLVMTRSKSVSICNRSHARRANSGKITISHRWCPRLRGISSPRGTKLPH